MTDQRIIDLLNEKVPELLQESFKKIERVVCSGGGAKGVVYPGSYKAMVDTGVFKNVKELSGASAGSITAALMAFGMSPDELRELLLKTHFPDLLGERIGQIFGENEKGVAFLTKDGNPLLDYIRTNIVNTVRARLSAKVECPESLAGIYQKLADEAYPKITFHDLELLTNAFPDDFKQLVIPAVKFPNGEIQIFNSRLTPDVEVALASRASSSIPVILKPVKIVINGEEHTFVDGGVIDNLPTDFFDVDENGEFIKNTKPNQTLVFAFGEGLENEDNQIFQALYGRHWDQVFTEELLETVFEETDSRTMEKIDRQGSDTPENREIMFRFALEEILNEKEEDQKLVKAFTQIILEARKKSQEELEQAQPNIEVNNRPFAELASLVHKQIKGILYEADLFEKLKRNVLIEVLGDFSAPYKNTEKKELGFQKLHAEYALRTVELRVGEIKTTHFKAATKIARVMDSLGYLDTINHITSHELHDENFDAKQFYVELVDNFEKIYEAVLLAAGTKPEKDPLTQNIQALKTALSANNKPVNQRQIYQLIKDYVERNLDSAEAFALSRALEFKNKSLTADDLFKETYEEGFKRSGISVSNITGEQIFSAKTLHKRLKNQNMFTLYVEQKRQEEPTRTDLVYASLSKLENFKPPQEREVINDDDDDSDNDLIVRI